MHEIPNQIITDLKRLRTATGAIAQQLDAMLAELEKEKRPVPRIRQDLKSKRVADFEMNNLLGKWSKPQQLRKAK